MNKLDYAIQRAANLQGPSLHAAVGQTNVLVGVTGTINIDAERDATGKKLVIEEIKNGQLTLKATIDPAKGGKVEMNNGAPPPAAPPTSTAAPKATSTTTTG